LVIVGRKKNRIPDRPELDLTRGTDRDECHVFLRDKTVNTTRLTLSVKSLPRESNLASLSGQSSQMCITETESHKSVVSENVIVKYILDYNVSRVLNSVICVA